MVAVPTPPFGASVSEAIILARMLASMASDLDKSEGSLPYSLMAPLAVEIDLLHDQLDLAVTLGFAQSAYGGFLDARAEEHGVFRREATVAVGEVTFSGTDGTVIPAGTLVSTLGASGSAPAVFTTLADGTIAGGDVTVDAVAVLSGAAGNVSIGAITQMVGFISGVQAISNEEAFSGGADLESDELFRERLLTAVSVGRGAGTAGDYQIWAAEVPGVGEVSVTPVWDGPGTVLVMILDVDGAPASAGLITLVETYLATLSPIGADVTVDTPTPVSIDVAVDVSLEPGFTLGMVEDAVEAAVAAYIDGLGTGDDVVLTEVGAVVVTTVGVSDYTGLTLDDGGGAAAANVVIAADELAVPGTVVVT